ncbi:hypothetical protein QNH36_07840 [Mesobacillus sp. AQ2]|uniref:hypothetical protein n=1 Tax=Bacillaceae TaxID=186817 RepID=UPI00203DB47E|nr:MULTISPECIES: hypothetical protein [Bacillaceae]MCM3123566.1 hypothetical protein [Mesobacillus sp. MER 33]MCM3232951.1 hypothetical protein [Mesobacillus sp. MER 48]WHX42879.1 hypothetical protein QNH36_07840 [Mesobacillus sp. AQ2]
MWSIALPGFAQLLTGNLVKGILFVLLEFLVNVQSNFNKGIMYSFLGETGMAMQVMDYQWLMFYPCLYMFAMWDAYRSVMPEDEKITFLPFVFSAYFVTVGLMISPKINILGIFPGPVFLPMMFVIPGVLVGLMIRKLILRFYSE